MIVFINGSFGSGKTTVAQHLKQLVKGSKIFDPEWVGIPLMHFAKVLPIKGSGTDDFQDIEKWRTLTSAGIRVFGWFASGPVIVPMAVSERLYLKEILDPVKAFDPDIRLFCLRADLRVIRERLTKRGEISDSPGGQWLERRIVECDVAHRDPFFGEPIFTDSINAVEVAEQVAQTIRSNHE